jgi:hypothetical protein
VPDERPSRVDDLREQLRALGYLDARVGRFVLGGAARRARPAALAAAASARIGLLAGVLLGPAAAVGLRWRAPGLVTGATDAAVLALYLAVLFGMAGAIAAFGAILAGGLAARRAGDREHFPARARRAAAAAGVVVGLACVSYLTLWWRAAIGFDGSTPVAWTAGVLSIAVAISLLLGHAVTITVLAFLARLGLGQSLAPGTPLSSWKAIAPLAGIALSGALVLLLLTAPSPAGGDDVPALTVVPTGERVVVIAIDGVDVATLDRLDLAGRLPHVHRLLGGATATLLSDADRDPARVWTTIATGQPPERHGIRALESRQVAGLEGRLRPESPWVSTLAAATDLVRLTRPSIASGDQRLIPAFWEVAARAGLRTATIHWWATWPAPVDLGVVLSDRAILRLERGGALDGEIAPASLYTSLRETWAARRDRATVLAQHAVPAGVPADAAAVLERSAQLDATLADLAADSTLGGSDLLVVYLPGLDIAQHALFGAPNGASLTASAAAGRVASLEQYYVYLDELLGSTLLANTPPDRLVVLITQPGRVAESSPGLLAISGAPSEHGRGAGGVTDAAPTILYALGVPTARDLAGHPLTGLFGQVFAAAHPVRDVATYGSRVHVPRAGTGRPLDKEMIERMKSLGYVR